MGTFEGLGVPRFGEYYRYSEDQTESLFVEDNGVHNFTFTDVGADNFLAVTVTDSNTVTSGYLQSFYTSITTSGSWTTGAAQINAFAVDLTLGGTIGCEAEGFYVYIAGTGTPTLTSANISGMVVYIENLGANPSTKCGIQLHMADGSTATGQDAFIVMRMEGSSSRTTNMFQKSGTSSINPDNFLATNCATGMLTAGDYLGGSPASSYGLRVLVGATIYYIPLITES